MMRIGKKKIEKAVRYVKQDVEDDFWPDILMYEDYFTHIDVFYNTNFMKYHPQAILPMDIPKQTLILRPGHFVTLKDRIYYQILVNEFAQTVDKKLVSRDVSFGNRLSLSGSFFTKPFENIESWKKFRRKSELYFQKNPDGFLLETDINTYFEHIKIKKLTEVLRLLRVRVEVANRLSQLLNSWTNGEEIGIPQGNNCSSFLGNVYLHQIDQAMLDDNFKYYRFADDIRIFADSEREIRVALAKLTELLRPFNLHLNSGKTKILRRDEYLDSKYQLSEEMDAVHYGLNLYKYNQTTDLSETIKELKQIWKKSVRGGRIINKSAFNFSLYRFMSLGKITPLSYILRNNLCDPSFSPIVLQYLKQFVDRKPVQRALIDTFNNSIYTYQKIYILRILTQADKLKLPVSELSFDTSGLEQNFMLLGYYFVFRAKFGNEGVQTNTKNLFMNNFSHDEKIARYFAIALSYYPNAKSELNQLLRTLPVLKPTIKHLQNQGKI
ncbi:MAG: RNA-directed DNA polymerase [Candidatus Pacebacteria bacterium]|nr:RNA-directed DNA polymerase [Candidatus Paceibacterota bacterium]